MKRFLCICIVICATLTLLGCGLKSNKATQAPTQALTTIIYTPSPEAAQPVTDSYVQSPVYTEQPLQSDPSQIITETISASQSLPDPAPVPSASVQESTTMGKTGDMAFSDDPDNKFIASVSAKYGVSTDKLVVLYTVPDNNSNIVLEFDGSKDSNGRPVRNTDTLVAIYSIDLALNSKCASKDSSRNEYPYGEMMVMFMTTTKYIMPEFQEELNG